MADLKPPRLEGSERDTVMALLQFQRESVVRKVSGVADADLRSSPVGTGTSLLWLVVHLAHAELLWVLRRFAGEDVDLPGNQAGPEVSLDAALSLYRTTWDRVDAVVASARDLEERCRWIESGDPPTLRWVLLHLLEETARHAGHADILRELIDGSTGR
jgi:uncharacterized damage-inducible protein DinB